MRRVLVGGLAGAVVLIAWLFVADGLLGFKRGIEMDQLGEERIVYTFLAQHVTEPGRYVINPEVLPGQGFPGEAPIFAVHFSGLGHEDAGQELVVGLVSAILACVAGAWLLAHASGGTLCRYRSRVLFLAAVGAVVALLTILGRFGLSGYSLGDAIALGLHDLAAWVLAALVISGVVKASEEQVSRTAA